MTEAALLDDVIRREGSRYTNRPSDRGGPTKWGITLATLRGVRGEHMKAADVAALTEDDARMIYSSVYVRAPGFNLVADERLRALLIDYGINSGQATAIKALQRAVGAEPDGVIGPETLRLTNDRQEIAANIYHLVMRQRLKLYSNLALNQPEVRAFLKSHPRAQLHNLAGWLNRFAEFL